MNREQVLNALGPTYAAALQVVATDDATERKQLYAALRPTFNEQDLAGVATPTLRKLNRAFNGSDDTGSQIQSSSCFAHAESERQAPRLASKEEDRLPDLGRVAC